MKTGIIIQARMNSSRLPGKIMMDLCGKPVIWHVYERLKKCREVDEIIIATTDSAVDDSFVSYLQSQNIHFYRGSEEDVLDRYYCAAKDHNMDIIVRITADCPLIEARIVDELCKVIKRTEYPIVTNIGISNVSSKSMERTFPRGLDAEVFRFSLLEEAYLNGKEKYHKEHVSPYMYENCKNIFNLKNEKDYSNYRWTVDTIDDFKLVEIIYNHFYKKSQHNFHMEDIIKFMKNNSDLIKINEYVAQKKVY